MRRPAKKPVETVETALAAVRRVRELAQRRIDLGDENDRVITPNDILEVLDGNHE